MQKKINEFKFNKPIRLYCITDAHIGSIDHDKEHFDKIIDMIKKDKDAYVFFNGDNIDYIPPNWGISQQQQVLPPQEQMRMLTSLLKSLKKKVLFIRPGNHEDRMWKLAEINCLELWGEELNIQCLGIGMERTNIYIGKKKYVLASTHGLGGSSRTVLNKVSLTIGDADVYFSGHTHELLCNDTYQTIVDNNGYEQFRSRIEIVGGSFIKYAEYAREKNMRPTQTGCYVLEFGKESVRVVGRV